MRERAESRGVPVYFPVWDLEDSSRVTVSEIWGRFLDQIEAASERYSPDKLLVVRVEKRYAGQWHVDWSYGDQGEWRVGTLLKASEAEAAVALVDEITGYWCPIRRHFRQNFAQAERGGYQWRCRTRRG